MSVATVQLQQSLDAIIFDCDGTLSLIEGIDELARQNGVSAPVESLTATAMGTTGINPQLYRDRLQLVKPYREQVLALGREYYQQQMPDAREVIQILQRLGKAVYLISAGLLPAVKIFGGLLQIPEANIFAVEMEFDQDGNFIDYDHASPMTRAEGKRLLVTEIKKRYPRTAFVGDGLNDLAAYDLVTRFVGMGGAYYRQNIADKCQFYVNEKSLTPLLPLVLTAEETSQLTAEENAFYQKGMSSITAGNVKFEEA
jgi:phosphoserine phosphatase